ncbi:uncharacterized protein A1O9_04017 [Exophiala aquamarina CBS 119918]|uniref:Uncharacterized protein n=1 Tax=Exophiala aquamarina CBS 119918 TaxID=1182545 RepID=A0A072PIN0_9EURO|nr:uncharacterized protein A1O9_04017 [Exophiala aquamarina CBS 119918]KEF59173.1 hypothetical protein A1O9_04017 [Exophiala aquamarina CBS 119918]
MRDLLDSLVLGPVIVRGHYDHDVKRFGEQYACGDSQAREQMKDVLINLQMTLIINLRSVIMDDLHLDFDALQSASDDCRVNAGVCLGQLSQRLSSAIHAQAYYPSSASNVSTLMPPMSPSLGHSSSRSTHSSNAPYHGPRTPEPMLDAFQNMSISPPVRTDMIERKTSTRSGGSQGSYKRSGYGLSLPLPPTTTEYAGSRTADPLAAGQKSDEIDRMSMRRRSSQALAPDDNILLMFPQPDGQSIIAALPNGADASGQEPPPNTDSLTSSPDISRFGPDDYRDEQLIRRDWRQYSHGTIYDMYQPQLPTAERHSSIAYLHRTQVAALPHNHGHGHGTFEHVRYLQENARPPRPQPRLDSLYRLPAKSFQPQDQPRQPRQPRTNPEMDIGQWETHPSLSPANPVEAPAHIDRYAPGPHTRGPPSPVANGLPPQLPNSYQHQSNVSKHLAPINPSLEQEATDSSRAESLLTVHSSVSGGPPISTLSTGTITLPTDKDLLGFCRGAFRLQIGLESKAFKVANRPVGYSSMIQFWRCEKCSFEGPMHNSAVLSEGKKKQNWKPVKLFDPKIRTSESGAIRYKWAFLAKCHVVMKGMVPYETALGQSGAFGTFGCIFCAAEGKQRGWLDKVLSSGDGASLKGSGASVRIGGTSANTWARKSGGKKGCAEPNSTPIFGNVGSFMAHLEAVHRPEDGWPNAEMQGRMKLVLGRTAPAGEDGWDVNIVPF